MHMEQKIDTGVFLDTPFTEAWSLMEPGAPQFYWFSLPWGPSLHKSWDYRYMLLCPDFCVGGGLNSILSH